MRKIFCYLVLSSALMMASHSWAQQTWRCPGNVYTNDSTEAQKIGDCKPLNSDTVTVIPGPEPSQTQNGSSNADADAERQQNAGQEDALKSQMRAALEAQLEQKRQELDKLQAEYNNGKPQRMGPEFRNYQLYLNRVERLKNEITQKQQEMQQIQEQLSTL